MSLCACFSLLLATYFSPRPPLISTSSAYLSLVDSGRSYKAQLINAVDEDGVRMPLQQGTGNEGGCCSIEGCVSPTRPAIHVHTVGVNDPFHKTRARSFLLPAAAYRAGHPWQFRSSMCPGWSSTHWRSSAGESRFGQRQRPLLGRLLTRGCRGRWRVE